MLRNNGTCRTLCTETVPADDAKFINDRIKEDYALNWLIDGLPAAVMKKDLNSDEIFFDVGFNLGNGTGEHAERPILNNHYDVYIRWAYIFNGHSSRAETIFAQIPRAIS